MPKTKMTISVAVQRMFLHSAQSHGPRDGLSMIEESLTRDEYEAIEAFLDWCDSTDRTFGWNLVDVVRDWENCQ